MNPAGGPLVCPGMMTTILAATLATVAAAAPAECITQYGRTVCGYDCIAQNGQIECAQTPYGACSSENGQVTCWDPGASVQYVYGPATPGAECVERFGQVACGYNCTAGMGQVACAATPAGRCISGIAGVICFDPPLPIPPPPPRPPTRVVVRPAPPPPPPPPPPPAAECVSKYGQTACGYGCIATSGQVMCAQTPGGYCYKERGAIHCVETQPLPPGPPPVHHWCEEHRVRHVHVIVERHEHHHDHDDDRRHGKYKYKVKHKDRGGYEYEYEREGRGEKVKVKHVSHKRGKGHGKHDD